MTTRGQINSNFYQIVDVDSDGNPTQVKPEYVPESTSANYANYAGTAYNVSGSNVSGTVANATYATNAGTVTTAAQPNITSLGTLTGLTSINTVDFITASNVSLGSVGNLHISGGDPDYVLKTDGAGNLSWTPQTGGNGGGTPGGLNTYVQFNDSNTFGGDSNFTFNKSTGTLSVTKIIANGSQLTNLTGANVSGTVANANYATYSGTTYSVSGSNVSGTVANANYSAYAGNATVANTANSVSVANVSGIGNIATINLDGSSSNVLYGNGVFSSVTATNANFANYAGNVTVASQPNITSLGNLVNLQFDNTVTPITPNVGQMFWDTGEHTVSLGMENGVTQQIGLESYIYVKASAAITDGQVVMFTGANGNNVTAAPADVTAVGFRAGYILGVATQNIANNGFGYITTFGIVHGLNTNAYNVGDLLWLNPAVVGGLTATQPSAPNYQIQIATVTKKAGGDGHIQVIIRPESKINDLSDVTITTPTTGQALIYDGSNVWINGNPNVANYAGSATTAGTVTTNAQPNITSTGTLTTLSVSNNVTATRFTSNIATGTAPFTVTSTTTVANLSVANATYANTSGTATSATTAGTVTTNAQPNITSTGTLTTLTVSGTSRANSAFRGNVIQDILGGTSTIYLGYIPGVGNVSGTMATQANTYIGLNGTSTLTVYNDANVTNNLNVANTMTAAYLYGDGSNITNLSGGSTLVNGNSNVVVAANANITMSVSGNSNILTITGTGANISGYANVTGNVTAGNVAGGNLVSANYLTGTLTTNAQPNITSVGTLTSLGVALTGNITGGNANIQGDIYGNTVRATTMTAGYFTSNAATGQAPFVVTSTTTVANLSVANATYATSAGSATSATSATTAGTVTTNAQPNITSTGTLTSLSVSGNITAGNVTGANLMSANYFTGTLTTAAQPNITSTGSLTSLTVTGNLSAGNISSAGTGNVANVNFTKYNETVVSGGSTGAATLTPDAAAGTIYKYTLTGNITLSTLSNAVAGTSMTIVLTQDGTGNRLLTSTMKFAGGSKTLSTAAGSIDIMSVFYDGSTYYAVLSKGYA